DVGRVRRLRADEGEGVVEGDRARTEVAGLHRRHLSGARPARARSLGVQAKGKRTPFEAWLVGKAHGVHELGLLEFFDKRLKGLEWKTKPRLDRGAAELVGERQCAQQQARNQVPSDVKIFEFLGGLDRAGLHRRANIPTGAQIKAPDKKCLALVKSNTPVPEYAALDLETTGLDPGRDRVIEVGAVAFTPDGVTASMERLVDPGRSVPEPVLRLTGIKQEALRGAASEEAVGLEEGLKESMLALVAPYMWPIARFFADALSAPNPDPMPASTARSQHAAKSASLPPDDPDLMAALLGPEGPLAGLLPGYEHREPQMQMLLAVAQLQGRGRSLLVEAGTGTGKRL